MMKDPLGYYQILNLTPEADYKAIKINYRDKAKLWHPDHNPSPNAMEEFQSLAVAYDTLKNPQSRTVYNLLSLIYEKNAFPDMKALKVYKSVKGDENPFLRVFNLLKILPSIVKPSLKEENLIGTFEDAQQFITEITYYNWSRGFWTPKSAFLVMKALKQNYKGINANPTDNYKLLIHNAAAYYQCGKNDKAHLSAQQALEYAPQDDLSILNNFLHNTAISPIPLPAWKYVSLQKIQLKIPYAIALIVSATFIIALLMAINKFAAANKAPKITYYQEVHFNSGAETVDDVVVAKVFNIPVDKHDPKMLYYTTEAVHVMYGPAEDFDVMAKTGFRQTVRVTGYTPDQEWFRVMLDNGEMGYIKKEKLKPGIGRDIPQDSKIFENPAL